MYVCIHNIGSGWDSPQGKVLDTAVLSNVKL